FGGEATLCRDLVTRLGGLGFKVRAAIADTVGCAAGVVRFGQVDIVPPGATKTALMGLPLAALRLSNRTVRALAQVGLKRVADIRRPAACAARGSFRGQSCPPSRSGPGR